MVIRYSDLGLDEMGAQDFVARHRAPTIAQIGIIFLSTFLIGVSIVMSVHDTIVLLVTLFALFTILGWYIIFQLIHQG